MSSKKEVRKKEGRKERTKVANEMDADCGAVAAAAARLRQPGDCWRKKNTRHRICPIRRKQASYSAVAGCTSLSNLALPLTQTF